MANKVVIFPAGKEAEAQAYKDGVNAHYAPNFEPGPPVGQFAYIRVDAFGQWVVPFYGPPWEHVTGVPFEEPAECFALRADGVLHDSFVWPIEE